MMKTSGVFFFFFSFFILLPNVSADTATGSGKTTAEAITGILRTSVSQNVNGAEELVRSILNEEVVPSAARFVQSYRIVPGSANGLVQVAADLDMNNLRALFAWNFKSTLEQDNRIQLKVEPLTIPAAKKMKEVRAGVPDPGKAMDSLVKGFLRRRGFVAVEPFLQSPSTDSADAEVKPENSNKTEPRFLLTISNRIDVVENENSHSKDDRFFLTAVLKDTRDGKVISKSTNSFHSPSSYKEQYYSDLYAICAAEFRDLLLDFFIDAGRKYLNSGELDDYFVVRIVNPNNMNLLQKFRAKVQEFKDVKSVLEFHFSRGAFDLALRPEKNKLSILKWIQEISSDDFELKSTVEGAVDPDLVKKPELFVRIFPSARPATVMSSSTGALTPPASNGTSWKGNK